MEIDARRIIEHPATPFVVAAALTALAYANAVGGEFLFDDLFLVRDARHVRDLASLWEMLRQMGSHEGFGYRPVRTFTHMLEYQLFGLDPRGYHVTNLVLHALTCVLAFRLARRLGLDSWTSLAGMAVFAVHPVHTEAVTYISGRRDELTTLFFFAAMLCYVRGVQEDSRGWVLATLPLYALSFFSKEMGITLPAVLYLWDALVNHRRRRWPRRLAGPFTGQPVFWSVLWAGALALFLYRGVFVARTMHPQWWGGTWASNFATVLAVHVRYLAVQLWPVDLLADYSPLAFDLAEGFTDPRSAIGAAVVACSLGIAWLTRHGAPLASFAVLSYWVVLLPVSHIIPHHELAAEHHLYLPSAAVCFAAGAGFAALERVRPRLGTGLAALVLIVLAALTLARNEDWRSEEALWSDTVAKAPRCGRALLNLATVHLDRGDLDRGEALLRESLRYTVSAKSLAYLGTVYTRRGEYERADEVLADAHERYTDHRLVIRFYALNLRHMGREQEAERVLERGVERHPSDAELHFLLAGSHVMQDEPREALEHYLAALEARPEHERARRAAALVARSLGDEGLAARIERGAFP